MDSYDTNKLILYGGKLNNSYARDMGSEARAFMLGAKFDFRLGKTDESYFQAYTVINLMLPFITDDLGDCVSSAIFIAPDVSYYREFVNIKCRNKNPRFEFIYVVLLLEGAFHANILIVDHTNQTVEHYEPNGTIDENLTDDIREFYDPNVLYSILNDYIENKFTGYLLLPNTYSCPFEYGLQMKVKKGWCALITSLYMYMRLTHPENSPDEINEFLLQVPVSDVPQILEALVNYTINFGIDRDIISYDLYRSIIYEKSNLFKNLYMSFYILHIAIVRDFDSLAELYNSNDNSLASLYIIYTYMIQNRDISEKFRLISSLLDTLEMSPSLAKSYIANKIKNIEISDIEKVFTAITKYMQLPESVLDITFINGYNGEKFPATHINAVSRVDKKVDIKAGPTDRPPRTAIEPNIEKVIAGLRRGGLGTLNDGFIKNITIAAIISLTHPLFPSIEFRFINPNLESTSV